MLSKDGTPEKQSVFILWRMYAYKKKKLKDGTTKDEHRLVMEKKLGRKLLSDECVHHKDRNKRNNDLQII